MRAQVGDRLVIKGHRIREPDRVAVIVEVRGQDGEPPYLVRWDGTDHTTMMYPGSDARIEPSDPASTS